MNNLSRVMIKTVVGFALVLSVAVQADSCTYVQENMFAGPFDVCAAPVSRQRCDEFAEEGSNANATYADAQCSAENQVGSCLLEDYTIIYYSGDAESLEVGCSFQGGEWK